MVGTFELEHNNSHLHEPAGFDCSAVFLTVSSLWRPSPQGHGLADRDLELNWEPSCDPAMLPDWVGLFDTNPGTTGESHDKENSTFRTITWRSTGHLK